MERSADARRRDFLPLQRLKERLPGLLRSLSESMSASPQIVTSKIREALRQLPYLPRAFALVWAAAHRWTAAWIVLLLVQGLLPVATVYLTRSVVDSLSAAIRANGDWAALRPTLTLIVLFGALLLLAEILRSATNYARAAQAELVRDHISALIQRKSIEVDLAFYDSPEFYDRLHRARGLAHDRPIALIENLGSLVQNSITLLAMGAVLFSFGVWIPLLLAAATLPALAVVLRYAVRQHLWRTRTTSDERRASYYDWLLSSSDGAAEVRLFSLGSYFRQRFDDLRARLRKENLALARSHGIAEFIASSFALAATAGALAWVAMRTAQGSVTLGGLAMFYQAFQQGLRLTRTLLENVGQLYYNVLFLGNLFEFLALQPRVSDPPHPTPLPADGRHAIVFRHVTFHYPNQERIALDDFSLEIPAGRITAVVGANGAGKSTLVKLLCRLYDPVSGSVEIDDHDLRSVSIEDLRHRITVLFQQPVRYNASASENIALGDWSQPTDLEAIREAARASGADSVIERLPRGYDQLLGNWFESGSELSFGEWQRIALARAFARRAPILVLDEPTSAMDPWAEADWLDRFRALADGRTVLIITHRFTTAMFADQIHVMREGRIVESGTHLQLLDRGGLYAAAWSSQLHPTP